MLAWMDGWTDRQMVGRINRGLLSFDFGEHKNYTDEYVGVNNQTQNETKNKLRV